MDFTRDPIIETIITPRDGCKLAVRSSKGSGQEEYFVDAIEVVSFGHSLFFRSLEKPKAFLVPVNDYEVIEVREARLVLKNVGPADRSIKIAGGREAAVKVPREEKMDSLSDHEVEEPAQVAEQEAPQAVEAQGDGRADGRVDKKRDRRRHYRKRRGNREEAAKEEGAAEPTIPSLEGEKVLIQPPEESAELVEAEATAPLSSNFLSTLLQPPPTLISETINRYRENALFKNAFFLSEEEQYKPHDKVHELLNEEDDELAPMLQEPTYEPLEESDASRVSYEKQEAREEPNFQASEESFVQEEGDRLLEEPSLESTSDERSDDEPEDDEPDVREESAAEENNGEEAIPERQALILYEKDFLVEDIESSSQEVPASEEEAFLPLFAEEENPVVDNEPELFPESQERLNAPEDSIGKEKSKKKKHEEELPL